MHEVQSSVVEGRTVVVTGAGSGIGEALAREAASRGAAHVALADRSDRVEAVAGSIEGVATTSAHVVDVADAGAVADFASAVIDAHGVPGLVCANAGVGPTTGPLLEASLDDLRWVYDVNVLGVLTTLQAFGRSMVEAEQLGRLLVTASEHALGVPHVLNGLYTSSKHAALGLADVMRRELPPHVGIQVLCPGLTTTGFWQATEGRPDRYGGAEPGNPLSQAILGKGMSAGLVAARAFDGIERGDFLIASHYNALDYARARSNDVEQAFDALAETDTSMWHVDDALAEVFSELDPS